MLGCGLNPNTSIHAIEEQFRPAYLMRDGKFLFKLIGDDGKIIEKEYEFHNFAKTAQRYDRLADLMTVSKGKVKDAEAFLLDTNEMWRVATEKMREDPYYFVDRY